MNIKIRYCFTNFTFLSNYKFWILLNVFDVKVKRNTNQCFIFHTFNVVQEHVMSWIWMGSFSILMTFCWIGRGCQKGERVRWGRDHIVSMYFWQLTYYSIRLLQYLFRQLHAYLIWNFSSALSCWSLVIYVENLWKLKANPAL